MLAEIKLGMVVDVTDKGGGGTHPYLVSKYASAYILAHPLYDTRTPDRPFQIPRSRIVEVLAENIAQYLNIVRNKGYLGAVCQSANSHDMALVTECCQDGTVKGFKLDDGVYWETKWPVKLADSVHEFYEKQVAKYP